MPGRSSDSLRRSHSSKPPYSYSSPKSPSSLSIPSAPSAPSAPSNVNHNHQVQQPGFFSNVLQGFGLGAGQSIAMNIFRSDPKVTDIPLTNNSESLYSTEFSQCLKDNWDDKEACKQYIQCLKDNKDDKSLCNQLI